MKQSSVFTQAKMDKLKKLEKVAISIHSLQILHKIHEENPTLAKIIKGAPGKSEALLGVKGWVLQYLQTRAAAYRFYQGKSAASEDFEKLNWRDYAAIRILDYIDNAGRNFQDLNLRGDFVVSNPIKFLWLASKYATGGAKEDFFTDMLHLFRQFSGKSKQKKPDKELLLKWMDRHPSGLEKRIVKLREKNRDRIIHILIKKIDNGEINSKQYFFEKNQSAEQKYFTVLQWWGEKNFHLKFAVRSPKLLNEFLDYSLDPGTMKLLNDAKDAGIPFFVNPYYLSLLTISEPDFAPGADLVIRDYIIYSKELIKEFGHLIAWEYEDTIKPGKPNIAGWMLPSVHNVHRRYPEVAILIPDTLGRACAGLCVSCQRMFDFQTGNLNFNLDKLKPKETWPQKLSRLLEYFEDDSQLRDILITGGDAFMSSDVSIKNILEKVYEMAKNKIEANKGRAEGKKFAEILRVRLGTRLPVYLPQRITDELVEILKDFKTKASRAGIKQFIIQTHFETAMEVTPEAQQCIQKLLKAGWMVSNQLVFTASASRRGHTAKLRKVLNDIGVISYYTFTVKGYKENHHNFATNARALQEQIEEKCLGRIPEKYFERIAKFPSRTESISREIAEIRAEAKLPYLATDRNVLNLPGIGKSLTFRTVGITRDGRRILEFDHDTNRKHSPVISQWKKVIIIESKSIAKYLRQLENMGEDPAEYESIFGYSTGQTEEVNPIFTYPDYDFAISEELTHFSMEESSEEDEF